MCSYSVWAPGTNFSYIWKSLPIPHDKVHLCGFAVLFLFPQMKSAFLGRAFCALVLKRTEVTHETDSDRIEFGLNFFGAFGAVSLARTHGLKFFY